MGSEQKSKGEPTPKQRQAIEHVHGPMLVVAGAGCGKTRVLSARIAHLVRHGHARADEILAVTYTENAAKELLDRVTALLPGNDASHLKATTFHAYCQGLLVRHQKNFAVLDEIDLKVYLQQHVAELPLKIFTKAANPAQFIADLVSFNARCLDELVSADEFREYVEELARDGSLPIPRVVKEKELANFTRAQLLDRCQEIAAVYGFVTERLRANGWGTFGDMLHGAVALLRADAKLLAEEQRRCRFILIDEFQDSNHAQIELARLLGGAERNVFGVGDPDQGIYKFRGATAEAFEEFRARFAGCVTVRLDDNFRSTQTILDCAHAVINANPSASDTGRDLKAAKHFEIQPPVKVMLSSDWQVEASAVADHIEGLHREGARWDEIAVLYRTHKQRESTAAELGARDIPVQIVGVELTDTPELRDVLAAARAMEAADDSVALFRVAALPTFAIKDDELQAAMQAAERSVPLVRTLRAVHGGPAVLSALEKAKAMSTGRDASGAIEAIQQAFGIPDSAPLSELRKFLRAWMEKPICTDHSLGGFLEYLELFLECGGRICAEREPPNGGVRFMTVHAAKGLEFKHVFVLHCASNSFPGPYREELFEFPTALSKTRRGHVLDPKVQHAQEQRRLFYVAMTRAEQSLSVCGALTPKRGEARKGFAKELLDARSVAKLVQRQDVRQATHRITAATPAMLPIERRIQFAARTERELKLSASAIETYERCPLQYKLEKEWKLPGEVGPQMQYGAAIHIAMKAYFDAVRVGRTIDLATLLASFGDEMAKTASDHDPHQHKLFVEQGHRQLSSFYESRKNAAEPKVLATEKWFDIEVQGVKIRGSIDRVDETAGGVHVVDYKTGRPKDDEDAKESLQLGVYALAAQRLFGTVTGLSFHNLEDGSVVTTERTRADLVNVERTIAEVSLRIRDGEFPPKKEDLQCRRCAYRAICPAHEQKTYTIAKAVATVQ